MPANLPTVNISFRREGDLVHTFIYLDFPEYRDYGDYVALANHMVLELLNCLGLNDDAGQQYLQQMLEQKTVRRRFSLSPEQESQLREKFFTSHW